MPPYYRHFTDQTMVPTLLTEMTQRHRHSYAAILDTMGAQLQAFFGQSFASPIPPSRFVAVDTPLVRPRVIVGLSGGIDSAVVTYLAVRALGSAAVLPVTMPAHPDDPSPALAAHIRQDWGFAEAGAPYEMNITPMVQAHMQLMDTLPATHLHLGRTHAEQTREQTMRSGNLASRIRIAVLSDLQRAMRGRILGTMNRTEYCQGYSTKYGAAGRGGPSPRPVRRA
jgi:NAD+ synthase